MCLLNLLGSLENSVKSTNEIRELNFYLDCLRFSPEPLWALVKSAMKWVSYPHLAELQSGLNSVSKALDRETGIH